MTACTTSEIPTPAMPGLNDSKETTAMIKSPAFPFTDRATYLAWRRAWKAQYKDLSSRIRETKLDIKNRMRSGNGPWIIQPALARLQFEARVMMQEIEEAKLEAARQYAAERQVVLAVSA